MTKIKIEIKHKITQDIIFQGDYENLKNAVQDANLQDADLQDANLRGADFWGADLRGANLRGAKIKITQKEELLKSLGIVLDSERGGK